MPNSLTDQECLLEISDINNAAYLMGRSFQNDPFTMYLIPDPKKRSNMLSKFFRIFLKNSIRLQQAYGVGYPLVGVAIWCFPGQKGIDIIGLLRAGIGKLLFQGFLFPFVRTIKVFRIMSDVQKSICIKATII